MIGGLPAACRWSPFPHLDVVSTVTLFVAIAQGTAFKKVVRPLFTGKYPKGERAETGREQVRVWNCAPYDFG
jgi:hypothetical protein